MSPGHPGPPRQRGPGLQRECERRPIIDHDPATGRFEHIGWFTEPREGETAVLLDDGRVLITGGGRAGGATAESFDPATGESTALTQPT